MALSFLSRLCLSALRQRQSLYLLISLSVVLEILQAFVPTRECDPLDAFANCIGVGFGALLGMMLRSRFRVFAY
jgi:VanZ family protein